MPPEKTVENGPPELALPGAPTLPATPQPVREAVTLTTVTCAEQGPLLSATSLKPGALRAAHSCGTCDTTPRPGKGCHQSKEPEDTAPLPRDQSFLKGSDGQQGPGP